MTKKIIIRYDEAESVWVWEYLPEGEEETHDLFMDPGEQIRLSPLSKSFSFRFNYLLAGSESLVKHLWTRGPRRLLPLRPRRRRGGPRHTGG